ncbi:MAG: DUF6364 family protein [Spirochaetaceae bacterium]|jgi:hypothetical protein|nr:DUF6364 family protein [Spirochaetaceae bacterium]
MLAKLTLTIDHTVIGRAKEYARSHNTSVSDLVETYLDRISGKERPAPAAPDSPLVDSMTGVVPDDGRDYRELLDEARAERFRQKGIGRG